ncbi:DHA2 family efflux MFS transporter permease subunit [Nocardia stercoris]|uniref:DHA2 family efflux MFS transporter permease subunit n=2 Tax=Nocardia stercoris TaxID=2483361 RepID=A0A3M2L063_9NOCA|nr:DHA2 family efflux MFS transporter permease subunit [Nocardia stercoris]
MGMLDTSLINVGLDRISADLGATLDAAQWIASAYLVALAVTLPLCGWLGRVVGADRLWLGALAGFTVTSGLCALAPSVGWLIVARIAQGLAAGFLVPAGQTLIGQVAGPHRLGRVMSVVGIAVVAAPAIGPTVGGLLLQHFSWPWLFLINLPLGVVAFVLGVRLLPASARTGFTPLDSTGFVLVASGLSLLVYGLGAFGTEGRFGAPRVWIPVVVGAVALAGFLIRSAGRADAILDIGLFRNRVFAAAGAANFFAGLAMYGGMLLLPLYFQILRGEGLVSTGLLLFSFGLGGVIALPAGGRLTDRFGGGIVSVAGNLVTALVTVPFVFGDASTNLVLVQVLLFVRGLAAGLTAMPAVTAAYASVGREKLADAASLVNILMRVGGSAGVALLAVVLVQSARSGAPLVSGYHQAFGWLTAATVVALGASVVLWRAERRSAA